MNSSRYLISNRQTKLKSMLTQPTQAAIATLHDISTGIHSRSANFLFTEEEWENLFHKLEEGQIIRLLPHCELNIPSSYVLCRSLNELSLLDVLEALDEPIYCNRPTPESLYLQNMKVAQKIGVLNQVTRTLLMGIKISDW